MSATEAHLSKLTDSAELCRNPYVWKTSLSNVLQSQSFIDGWNAGRHEVRLQQEIQTPEVCDARMAYQSVLRENPVVGTVSLITITRQELPYSSEFTIYYDHAIHASVPLLRGHLITLKNTLSGVRILQMDPERNRLVFDMYNSRRGELINILLNLFVNSAGFNSADGGGIRSVGGTLGEKLFVITDENLAVESVTYLSGSRYIPRQSKYHLSTDKLDDKDLPWSIDHIIVV